jgi:hypothetical protein|tara:strand:- start:12 stop:158 length:147 start_codon:yes stop_codon:yes gene_type:complete
MKAKKKNKKMDPMVKVVLILIAAFFLYKIFSYAECTSKYGADQCHLFM